MTNAGQNVVTKLRIWWIVTKYEVSCGKQV